MPAARSSDRIRDLRPGSDIGEGAHVGNFVETKKIKLGKGSKANHLTYLGDAEIGEGVNVGAGTITCNYDGVNKHKTVIGDGVFVGSDSTLVAPVKIGHGAYIGAASCITEDVPADALALGRARQTVKEGWAKAKRETSASRQKVIPGLGKQIQRHDAYSLECPCDAPTFSDLLAFSAKPRRTAASASATEISGRRF